MSKLYGIFGAALCAFFFFATETGIRIFAIDTTPHTRPTGAALHHK
ncbi:hypothetical protein KF707_14185 [Candidatus Obscuribacterales bacterium]|jgi:hypothetical protein|nr:hypothetical protein [Candidatus Obscuribacterales bacterium]MBX3137367.1 hypothetical protein [Candidatus Obscuribacterales bacterium]MBX3149750.1 hypothetical protein [Candidatus Obscuribacterales bacterium]